MRRSGTKDLSVASVWISWRFVDCSNWFSKQQKRKNSFKWPTLLMSRHQNKCSSRFYSRTTTLSPVHLWFNGKLIFQSKLFADDIFLLSTVTNAALSNSHLNDDLISLLSEEWILILTEQGRPMKLSSVKKKFIHYPLITFNNVLLKPV